MLTIRIGGVPEHFNLPWHLAIEKGTFEQAGIELQWTDYYGGTGALTEALREDVIDMGVILTEGMVLDIAKGNNAFVLGPYITSPLVWGIHVPASSRFEHPEELQEATYAISRFGSGSHLMAFVSTKSRKEPTDKLKFEVVGNFEGARKAFKEGKADVLLWEKTMTQPFVDSGEFRRIGEFRTPWPCFVTAVDRSFWSKNEEKVRAVLDIIWQENARFAGSIDSVRLAAERFDLTIAETHQWFARTSWSTGDKLSETVLYNIRDSFLSLGLIEKFPPIDRIYQPAFREEPL